MAKIADLNSISVLWRKIKQTFYTKRELEDLLGTTCVQEANPYFISIRNGDTQEIDFDIDGATSKKAGVMTADDKAKVDRILFGPDFVIGGGKPSTFYGINSTWNQFVTDNVVPLASSGLVIIFGTFSGSVYGTYQCIVNGFDYYLTLMGAGVGEACGGVEPSIITINGNRSNSTGIITWDNP